MANRTFYFAFFTANALEYGYRLFNPGFEEYAALFPALLHKDFRGTKISLSRPFGLLPGSLYEKFVFRLKKHDTENRFHNTFEAGEQSAEFDLNTKDFRQAVKQKMVFASGWNFRDHLNLHKHQDKIRQIFTPEPGTLKAAEKYIQAIKSEERDVVLAVHVRRSDYRKFMGGKYFFSDEFFIRKIKEAKTALEAAGKAVKVLICSDEHLDSGFLAKAEAVQNPSKSAVEDLYTLAKADYIMGPPSTFSMWASFWGSSPLLILNGNEVPVNPLMFKRIISLDRFEDGSVFRH